MANNIERKYIGAAILILILYLLPLFILQNNAHIRIHDNLDSNLAWYKILKESGQVFGPINAVIPQLMNGLSRNVFGTEFSGIVWLHQIFQTMWAYAFSQSITRIFAFIGMYLLIRDHFLKTNEALFVRTAVSLAFALTPVWPSGMLSTLGMPLALWAFLNIRAGKQTKKDWITLLILPFYSSFVLGFFFFLVGVGCLWLRDILIKKRLNLRFFGSIAGMTFLYLLIEYRLVYSLVFPEAPTSRNEFRLSHNDFWQSILLGFKNYFLGHTHDMTLHTVFILPILFIAIVMIGLQRKWKQQKTFVFLFYLNIALSFWYAFWFYNGWIPIKQHFSFLQTFNFSRFHFLHPLVIYLSFALGCFYLWEQGGIWKKIAKLFLILQIVLLICSNEEIRYRVAGTPSVKEFYATHLFQEIDHYIGKPKNSYRVVSIGIHPAIAQFNGFYTLDSYNNYYPLAYKHQFRKIIAPELNKNKILKLYFDKWGNRCYLFVDELGKKYDFRKDSKKVIHHLDINTKVLKEMGGKYIFSAVPILNAKQEHLKFLHSFEEKNAAWKIYLYQVE
jgi:hypothetical protein